MQKGLTLVELMIVITVISILSAIAVPAYQNYIARSQISEALTFASNYKNQVSNIYWETAQCPTLAELGFPDNTISSKYLNNLDLSNFPGYQCSLSLTFKNSGVSLGLAGKNLRFSMKIDVNTPATSQWDCTSEDIKQKYLPNTCIGI